MSVFRIYNDGQTGTNWFPVAPFGAAVIGAIQDPGGNSARSQITSIPSPFARIDLVKTAFSYVNNDARQNGGDPSGNTIYHKIVADTLDVGELLFNYERFAQNMVIHAWYPNLEIQNLVNSTIQEHKLLGQTLDTFWQQDANAYNFDKVNRLFIIKYNNRIVGGTSPATMFFSSPDIDSSIGITIGNNVLFDNVFDPLYRRDDEFQKYLLLLFELINPLLRNQMPELYQYISLNIKFLNNANPTAYNNIINTVNNGAAGKNHFNKQYSDINTQVAGNPVEVLGVHLKKNKICVPLNSDFIIGSPKVPEGNPPMVLQNGFAQPLEYACGTLWNPTFRVPVSDNSPLNNRVLPGVGIKYPYLTIDDFFENHLIRVPFKIDSDSYFNGNFESLEEDMGFLLPLKKTFFDYFNVDYLKTADNQGHKVFAIQKLAGGNVSVTLRIPIKSGDYLEFKKQYSVIAQNHLTQSNDVQVELPVSINIFPFLKISNNSNLNRYTVNLIDGDDDMNREYHCKVYDHNNIEHNEEEKTRSSKLESLNAGTKYQFINGDIQYIRVSTDDNSSGIIIPKLKEVISRGTDQFTFAIDFGTTNTHIEFSVNGDPPEPFEISKQDFFYRTFYDRESLPAEYRVFEEYLFKETFPDEINQKKGGYNFFPIRTALNENNRTNFNSKVTTFGNTNIAFFYELATNHLKERIHTNIKWSDYAQDGNTADKIRVEKYFENLLILIRNKILQNNGNLNNVDIKWLYPSSMLPGRKKQLENLWNKLAKDWISKNVVLYSYSESIAPFFYFKQNSRVSAAALPVASIDIGGETTDIVVFEKNKPNFITSFRFATNAIYGDGYGGSIDTNGFVQKYYPRLKDIFDNNDKLEFRFDEIYQEITRHKKSDDIISFFFSLKNVKTLSKIKDHIDLNKMLYDDDQFKILFVLFYTGIIYHLATQMHLSKKKVPRFITFSGYGSKILNVLEGDTNKFSLTSKLTTLIFKKVYKSEKLDYHIDLITDKEPKVITCKGCIEDKSFEFSEAQIDEIKKTLFLDKVISRENPFSYDKLFDQASQYKEQIIQKYNDFISFAFSLNSELNFNKYFNIPTDNISFYKDIMKDMGDLPNYLNEGLEIKQRELGNDPGQSIEETPFFYILIGSLNKLAYEIYTR